MGQSYDSLNTAREAYIRRGSYLEEKYQRQEEGKKMKWRKEKRHQEQIPTAKCAHQLKTRIYVHERKSSFAASRFEWSPSEVKGRGKGRKNVSFLKHPEYEEFLVVVEVRKSSNSGRIWRHDRTANVHGSFDAGIPDRWQTQVSRPKTRKSTKIRKKKKKKKMQFPEILSLSLQETQTRQSKGKQSDGPSHRAHATLQKASFSVTDLSLPASGHKTIYIGNEKKKRNQNVSFLIISPERTDRSQNDSSPMHTQRDEKGKSIHWCLHLLFSPRASLPGGKEPLAGRLLFVSPFSFWFPFWPFHPRSRAPPTLLESNPASSRYIYLYNMSEWRDR